MPEVDTGKAGRDGEEKGRARRRRLVRQQQGETQSMVTGEGKQDDEPKEEIKVVGRQTMRRESPLREDREGERHTRKPATFQEESGSSRYVKGAGEENVINSRKGTEDHKAGKSYLGTN
ncbi:hypothetical protein NDU88_002573 [Pleurodeles waltl]|uniref:Uncharacterized protein n=1 Tax=Pleurodeles waltl TaxID=8319 RepID=A0AAV7UXL5_PLEWA|nr:hypothetical protein NDU88_002573 [Pleurodeles waltl]